MVTIKGEWVEFSFFRPDAKQVFLAGDFNHWNSHEEPMLKGDDGVWRARLRMGSGEYRFRYCADGEWFADYAACGLEPGRFGLDSLVIVPAQPIRVATETYKPVPADASKAKASFSAA